MTNLKKPDGLYVVTLLIEFFISALARMSLYGLIMLVPMGLLAAGLFFIQSDFWQAVFSILLFLLWLIGMVIGYGPIALSILAYLGYGSGSYANSLCLRSKRT